MTRPVTSTSVATKRRRGARGIEADPAQDERQHRAGERAEQSRRRPGPRPPSGRPAASAGRSRRSRAAARATMRTMPMTPEDARRARGRPAARAARPATSRRSAHLAAAPAPRMISEVACEPELPPELMMSGMNSVSTIARLDLALEVLHRGGGEHLAEEERAEPAGRASGSWSRSRSACTARRAPPCRRTSARPRSARRSIASMTSSTVTMPSTWP